MNERHLLIICWLPVEMRTRAGRRGQQADAIHALLCGAGHDLRLILRHLAWLAERPMNALGVR